MSEEDPFRLPPLEGTPVKDGVDTASDFPDNVSHGGTGGKGKTFQERLAEEAVRMYVVTPYKLFKGALGKAKSLRKRGAKEQSGRPTISSGPDPLTTERSDVTHSDICEVNGSEIPVTVIGDPQKHEDGTEYVRVTGEIDGEPFDSYVPDSSVRPEESKGRFETPSTPQTEPMNESSEGGDSKLSEVEPGDSSEGDGGNESPPEEPPLAEGLNDNSDEIPENIREKLQDISEGDLKRAHELFSGISWEGALDYIEMNISEEDFNRAHELFSGVSWEGILDYFKKALKSESLQAALKRHHGITLEAPETEEPNLQHMKLTDIGEQEREGKVAAGTWQTEKERREDKVREEAKELINKYRKFIPLDEIPLPKGNFTISPDLAVKDVDTPIYAYGLWRDILINSYEERIVNEPGKVRGELRRLGGRVPLIKKVRQWQIAWGIMTREKSTSPGRDYGIAGLGLKRWRELVQLVHYRDARVVDARRALSVLGNRSHFVGSGQDTARKGLARDIVDIVEYEAAFKRRMSSKIGPHRNEGKIESREAKLTEDYEKLKSLQKKDAKEELSDIEKEQLEELRKQHPYW